MAVDLLENGEFGEVYNMGSEDGIQIYDLANLIGKLMGHEEVNINVDQARVRPWEIWHLQSDNTKLYSVIKSRPEVNLEEALNRTIKFYFENGKKWDWKK
jgi:nucleoside-diphosphate-sugar epimerase